MDITEGNKLIAEFMGNKPDGTIYVNQYHNFPTEGSVVAEELLYHESWDWLMPVVEKIESEGFKTRICFDDFGQWMQIHFGLKIVDTKETKVVNIGGSKLENTYNSVIEFIKLWNIKIGV